MVCISRAVIFGVLAALFACGDDSAATGAEAGQGGSAGQDVVAGSSVEAGSRAAADSGRGGGGGGAGAAAISGRGGSGHGASAGMPSQGGAGSAGMAMMPMLMAGAAAMPGPAQVRWVGRVAARDASAVQFAWQGAGFIANVQGSALAVKLRTEGTDTAFFQAVIDGKATPRFEVKSGADREVMLGMGLDAGMHRVELYRETEGMYGLSTFLGFTRGTLMAAPAASARLIEVVGDSISAGYGNLGSEPHPDWVANPACSWTAANSSWYQTYAAIAGRALEAEVSTIARSGWGMCRDGDGNMTGVLSSVYDHTLGTESNMVWGFERKASVVVINLGTNDWNKGDPGTVYETAYRSFLQSVRAHYPDAWIFLTIGSMLSQDKLDQVKMRLQHVADGLNDEKLHMFDLGIEDFGADGTVPTGCDWHPSAADHKRMSDILVQQLKAKLNW